MRKEDIDIDEISLLAKLELAPEEREQTKADIRRMIRYLEILDEADTGDAEPMFQVFPVSNVFREDVVSGSDGSEAALSHAPKSRDGGFLVPETIGEDNGY